MQITLCSFLASIFWSTLLIAGMYFLRRRYCIQNGFSLWAILVLYLLSMARAFFPAEISQVIVLGDKYLYAWFYVPFRNLLKTHLIERFGFPLSVGHALLMLWAGISVLLLIRHFFCYHKACVQIRKYASMCHTQTYTVFESVQNRFAKPQKVSLYTMPNIEVPFGVGLFHKSILLPQNTYTDEELYYILLHEYTHFQNHDILIKFMVSIFCCIFWWNPIVYLLRADLEQMLEIKCDTTVVRNMKKPEKAAYLRTIVMAMRNISPSKPTCYTSTTFIHSNETRNIKERFQAVMHYPPKTAHKLSHFLVTLVCVLMLSLSYILLPQPVYEAPPSTEPNMIDLTPLNTQMEIKKDGTYWIHIEGTNSKQISEEDFNFFKKHTDFPIICEEE